MIVDEKLDRFATNWGVIPTSIDLSPKYTTNIDAMNIELSGPSFNKETDFGDGLTGLKLARGMGLGDALPVAIPYVAGSGSYSASIPAPSITPADLSAASAASGGFDLTALTSGFSMPTLANWTWEDYVMALSGLYIGWQILFGPKATQRKQELRSAEEGYRKRRKRIKEDYSFSPFGVPSKSSSSSRGRK
jgi:hypothetical protein